MEKILRLTGGPGWRRGEALGFRRQAGQNGLAVTADAFDDFFGGFQDHDFLTGRKADHGVGSRLDFLDQVAVEDDPGTIETGDLDHKEYIGERGEDLEEFHRSKLQGAALVD